MDLLQDLTGLWICCIIGLAVYIGGKYNQDNTLGPKAKKALREQYPERYPDEQK